MASRDDGAVRITSAPEDPKHDIAARQRRYVISMTIRLLCLFAAFLLSPTWGMWVALAGAVFLPYVAVVGANTKNMRKDEFSVTTAGPQWQLPHAEHGQIAGQPTTGDEPRERPDA
jgi:hypothetical protein